MENTEQYTYSIISPKTLAEELAVNLVKTSLKTHREAVNVVDNIQTKAKGFLSRIRDTVHTVQAVPNKVYSSVRMSIQNRIDSIANELKSIKSNISQRIDDIDKGRYEINRSTIDFNFRKPTPPRPAEVVAATGMELITPKEMVQTLHENMGEIKQNAKGVFQALDRLKSAVGKLLRDMSPLNLPRLKSHGSRSGYSRPWTGSNRQ